MLQIRITRDKSVPSASQKDFACDWVEATQQSSFRLLIQLAEADAACGVGAYKFEVEPLPGAAQ